MMAREEQCDGWFLEEVSEGSVWQVTRDNWDEYDNPARPVYYGDIQLDQRLSCDHRKWYLARWTPRPENVLPEPVPLGNRPLYNMDTFTVPGRFESVDDAVGAVVLMHHYAHTA
jgi:hypothetical protein